MQHTGPQTKKYISYGSGNKAWATVEWGKCSKDGIQQPRANSTYPNCRRWEENAAHLNRFPDKERQLTLIKCIEEIEDWMIDNHTYPELIDWIPKYLLPQWRANFVDLGNISQTMRQVGAAQDKIAWRLFADGKIAQPIRKLQEYYLSSCLIHLTIDLWMWGLIRKLLNLTHSQWIFCNITKHHHNNGVVKLETKQDITKEIKRQLNMRLYNLPPESKYLLKIDTSELLDRKLETSNIGYMQWELPQLQGNSAETIRQ